jgi:uncharacterized protein YndB with AHSA1/START domain
MLCDMVHEVEIQADPSAVYRAIATQEGQTSFWTTQSAVEPRVGSVAEFRFPSAPVPLRMRIDELQDGRRIAWTCLGEFPGWKDTTVSWELTPMEDGKAARLVFRHGNLARAKYPEQAVGSVNYTWGQVLGRLKAYAESHRPQPLFE